MAYGHCFKIMLVACPCKRVGEGLVAQIWAGEIVAVFGQFLIERLSGVESGGLGVSYLELVVHKHIDIFVDGLGLKLLRIVFLV